MGLGYLIGALALALVHILSGTLRLNALAQRRRWLSLAAGVSVAYVFLDLLPLMGDKEQAFVEAAAGRALPVPQLRVYVAALLGFTIFYGLEHYMLRRRGPGDEPGARGAEEALVPVHLGSFALYNLMLGYLLVEWSRGPTGLALYCAALALHLLVTDEGLRRDYGAGFERLGRWLMAACLLAGVLLACAAPLAVDWLTIVVGLVAGGVVINSIKEELPRASEGRFAYFVAGTLGFGLMVVWAAWLGGAG